MQHYADRTEEEQEEPKTGAHADVWDQNFRNASGSFVNTSYIRSKNKAYCLVQATVN
jgi:hypothetical protein